MKINWKDHLVNLIVVILGISIAFALENYAEKRQRRSTEKMYMTSLLKDLETDQLLFDTLIAINENILESLNELTAASIDPSEKEVSSHLFTVMYNPPFSSQRMTYESLKSLGQVEIISSFSLRSDIVELYEQYYRGCNEYDEAINNHIEHFLSPFFIKKVRFVAKGKVKNDFVKNPEFQNIIFSYRNFYIQKTNYYKEVNTKLKSIMEKATNHANAI